MKLLDLEPQFLQFYESPEGRFFKHVDTIEEATGIRFLCPLCWTKNKGPIRTHAIICWTPKVPADLEPKPGRWNLVGKGLDDLSLVAGSSSILLTAGCRWHGHINNGEVEGGY